MPFPYPLDDDAKVSTPANRLRRQLLKGTAAAAVAAAFTYLGWTRWLFPPEPAPPEGRGASGVELGAVSDFPIGGPPKQVNVTTPGTDHIAVYFVENLGGGGFRVLSAKCTHQGCSVAWQPKAGQFLCPCHGAQFDAAGRVLAAPAPRPLPLLASHVRGETLYLTA